MRRIQGDLHIGCWFISVCARNSHIFGAREPTVTSVARGGSCQRWIIHGNLICELHRSIMKVDLLNWFFPSNNFPSIFQMHMILFGIGQLWSVRHLSCPEGQHNQRFAGVWTHNVHNITRCDELDFRNAAKGDPDRKRSYSASYEAF
jgi:hypothetical protein